MPHYMTRAKVSKEAMDALVAKPEDRLVAMTRVLKEIGGRMLNYYFSFGEYDIVLIYELPDNGSAAAVSMALSASGSVTEMHTTPLMTMSEAVDAMHHARRAAGVYSPPRGPASG